MYLLVPRYLGSGYNVFFWKELEKLSNLLQATQSTAELEFTPRASRLKLVFQLQGAASTGEQGVNNYSESIIED